MILQIHKTHLPSFGFLGLTDQQPVCVMTVLCLGGRGDDCAAYRAITPDLSMRADYKDALEMMAQRVRRGGNKIDEEEARKLFVFRYDGADLSYRR